jgi:hypothetical protein
VAEVSDPIEVLSTEFLEPSHPLYALRPKLPLESVLAFHATRISFCYPGGEDML